QSLMKNSISVCVRYGTSTAAVNYNPDSVTLNFFPSTTSQIFIVPILHDNVATGPLTVQLQLSNPTGGAQLGSIPQATLTIADVDPRTNAQSVINLHSFDYHNGGNTPICDLALSGNTL